VGSLLFSIVGWLAGALMLWASPTWTTREKWIGTLVPPGGFVPAWLVGLTPLIARSCASASWVGADGVRHTSPETCAGLWPTWLVWALLTVLAITSVVTAVWLAQIAARRSVTAR
jgi:hypothetical protein